MNIPHVRTAEDDASDAAIDAWKAKQRADALRVLRARADAEHRARFDYCVRMYAARQSGSIADVIALEHSAGD